MGKIAIVGEAWGKDEEAQGAPFVGYAGRILRACLHQVGINFNSCLVTNVFNLRPTPTNNILNLCGPKAEGIPNRPPLAKGKYVRAEFAPELERLKNELLAFQPNVVIALGGTATWALLGTSGIKQLRGCPFLSDLGLKVLPTWHPSAVGRDWKLRPQLIADLTKARRESRFPEVRRPRRELWIDPTLDDISTFTHDYITPSPRLSVDIETIAGQITCIGFAPSPYHALVIPFHDPRQEDGNYWRTLEEELEAWALVREILADPAREVVGQNFLYDANFLWAHYHIPIPRMAHDTMLLHHSLQPELPKGLDWLASVYTNEPKWKFMGGGGKKLVNERKD